MVWIIEDDDDIDDIDEESDDESGGKKKGGAKKARLSVSNLTKSLILRVILSMHKNRFE